MAAITFLHFYLPNVLGGWGREECEALFLYREALVGLQIPSYTNVDYIAGHLPFPGLTEKGTKKEDRKVPDGSLSW